MIPLNERRKIVGSPFLSFFMEMWFGTILLKNLIILKNAITHILQKLEALH